MKYFRPPCFVSRSWLRLTATAAVMFAILTTATAFDAGWGPLRAADTDLEDWLGTLFVPSRPETVKAPDIGYRCGRDGRECSVTDFMARNRVCGLFVVSGPSLLWSQTRSAEVGTDCDRAVRGEAHGIASMTKSITSILFGILFTDRAYGRYYDAEPGKLEGQPVARLLAPEVDYPDEGVTVEHILQMRSGMDFTNPRDGHLIRVQKKHAPICTENPASDPRCTIRGQVNSVLASAEFDTRRPYNYSNFDTQIIGLLIQKRLETLHASSAQGTGHAADPGVLPPAKLITAFDKHIARKAGFEKRYRWKVDFDLQSPAPCCLRIAGTDLAKFGAWVLSNYRSDQGVVGKWLRRSIANRVKQSDNYCTFGTYKVRMQYGYQWWIPNAETDQGEVGGDGFVAIGRGGQYVHVFPKQNVVVVQQTAWDPEPIWGLERSRNNRACEAFMVRRLIADKVAQDRGKGT